MRNLLIIFTGLIILTACSSIKNINTSDNVGTLEFNSIVEALKPSSNPSELGLGIVEGDYIIANISDIPDGDTVLINNLNLDFIDEQRGDAISQKLSDEGGSLYVRFISIDTPEKAQKQHYSDEAKQMTEELLYDEVIIIELDPLALFDNYNRLLGHVYTINGQSVQKALLENGLARTAYLYDDYKYTNVYKEAERAAKEKALNIHSIKGYVKEKEMAGYNMDVVEPNSLEILIDGDPADIVERMKEIDLMDIFNFEF